MDVKLTESIDRAEAIAAHSNFVDSRRKTLESSSNKQASSENLVTSSDGLSLKFRSHTPGDGPGHGDSLVRAEPVPMGHAIGQVSKQLQTSSDHLNVRFGLDRADAHYAIPHGDDRGGAHIFSSSRTGPPEARTAPRPRAVANGGPMIRYSTMGDQMGTLTHATTRSAEQPRQSRHESRRQSTGRPQSAGVRVNKPRLPASSSPGGQHCVAPEFYSLAHKKAANKPSAASRSFDAACASACAHSGIVSVASNSPLNRRHTPGLGYVSPQPVSPFGKADFSTRSDATPACVARGGPSGGGLSPRTNEYLILKEMAAAANAAEAEAARSAAEAREQALHASQGERVAVQRHVEAQQAAVAHATAAADGWGQEDEPPPSYHASYEPPVLAPPVVPAGTIPGDAVISTGGMLVEIRSTSPATRSPAWSGPRSARTDSNDADGGPDASWDASPQSKTFSCATLHSEPPSPSSRVHLSPATRAEATSDAVPAGSPTYRRGSGPSSDASNAYSAAGGGMRAIQLITAPQPVPPPPSGSNTLRRALDVALRDSSKAREDCVAAQQEAMQELQQAVWPNQASGLVARALVVRLSRAAARMRAAGERLEKEADVAHHAHRSEMESAFHRYAYMHGYLANQRDTIEATLGREVGLAEQEHEGHVRALRATSMGDYLDLQVKLDEERKTHRHAVNQLESDLLREQRKASDAMEKISELEKKALKLQEANATLETRWKTEVEGLRNQAHAQKSKDKGMHASETARLESTLLRIKGEKEALEQKVQAVESELEGAYRQMEANDQSSQLRIDDAVAAGRAEAVRLQREIDRQRALHTAALAAGSYKGRQLLYMDSLQKAQPRANHTQDEAKDAQASISWRGNEEIHHLTQAMVGQAAAESSVRRSAARSVPASGFVKNPSYEALGEQFGSTKEEREVVHRMLDGDRGAATGLVSYVPLGQERQ